MRSSDESWAQKGDNAPIRSSSGGEKQLADNSHWVEFSWGGKLQGIGLVHRAPPEILSHSRSPKLGLPFNPVPYTINEPDVCLVNRNLWKSFFFSTKIWCSFHQNLLSPEYCAIRFWAYASYSKVWCKFHQKLVRGGLPTNRWCSSHQKSVLEAGPTSTRAPACILWNSGSSCHCFLFLLPPSSPIMILEPAC